MKKIEAKYIRTEYNVRPYVLGYSIAKMKEMRETDLANRVKNTLDNAARANGNNITNKFMVDLNNIVKEETEKGIFVATPYNVYDNGHGTIVARESVSETKRKLSDNIKNFICFDRKKLDTPNVLQYIHGISENDLNTVYDQDETFNISYLDPIVTTSNFTYTKNFEESAALEHGSRYYYITKDNVKSFIRPMLDIPTYYQGKYRRYSIEDFQREYHYLKSTGSEHSDIVSGIFSLLSYLRGKIVITKTKRINLSAALVSISKEGNFNSGYIREKLIKCPILESYCKQGYTIDQDEITNVVNQFIHILKTIHPTTNMKDFNEHFQTGLISNYDAIHAGPNISNPLDHHVPDSKRKNYSITIVKTDYIDVDKCGLHHEGTMYLPEHDIVLGVVNKTFENISYSHLEKVIHPYSKEALLLKEKETLESNNENCLQFKYVVENIKLVKPIFIHTFGKLTTLYPIEDTMLTPGLYVIEDNDSRLIEEQDYLKYGIFTSKEKANLHLDYLNSEFKDEEHVEEILKVKKSELENSKLISVKEITEREQEVKHAEFDVKQFEADVRKQKIEYEAMTTPSTIKLDIAKTELDIAKTKGEKYTTTMKIVKDIVVPLLGIIGAGLGLYATILKNGGGKQ